MGLYPSDTTQNASNGKDRNALELGLILSPNFGTVDWL